MNNIRFKIVVNMIIVSSEYETQESFMLGNILPITYRKRDNLLTAKQDSDGIDRKVVTDQASPVEWAISLVKETTAS